VILSHPCVFATLRPRETRGSFKYSARRQRIIPFGCGWKPPIGYIVYQFDVVVFLSPMVGRHRTAAAEFAAPRQLPLGKVLRLSRELPRPISSQAQNELRRKFRAKLILPLIVPRVFLLGPSVVFVVILRLSAFFRWLLWLLLERVGLDLVQPVFSTQRVHLLLQGLFCQERRRQTNGHANVDPLMSL